VHIDIDPAEIGKNVAIDYPLVSDVKKALQALLKNPPVVHSEKWIEQVQTWYHEYPLHYKQENTSCIKPQLVIDTLSRLTDGRAIITTEVGQHQMWAAHFYQAKAPRTFITSGGLGTMGYGFPAAMGAQIARPDATVVCIAGDASFQMNLQELQTIAERNLPVKVFVINNHFMGMVRQWQEMFHDNRLSESKIGNPDFVQVAEAFQVKGIRVTTAEQVEAAIQEALSISGPVVVDFVVEEEENLFPMVPPGKGNDEMLVKGWDE
jgi:acetolactate synthase-1/2/3 large subunit